MSEPPSKTLAQYLAQSSYHECLIPDKLWVVSNIAPKVGESCWMEATFLEYQRKIVSSEGQEVSVRELLLAEGPLGGFFSECKHSHWGHEGYLFRPNFDNMRAIFDWLEKLYSTHNA